MTSRLFKFDKKNLGVSAEQLRANPGMNEIDIFMAGLNPNDDTLEILGNKVKPETLVPGTSIFVSIDGNITHKFQTFGCNQPVKIDGKTIVRLCNVEKLAIPVMVSSVPSISNSGHAWPKLDETQIEYIEQQQPHNNENPVIEVQINEPVNLTVSHMYETILTSLRIEQCSYIELITRASVMLGVEEEPIITNARYNIRTKITYIYNQIV